MKKHKRKIRSWHHPAKTMVKKEKGKCGFCKRIVKNLGEHMKRLHKGVK